jgi:hypothetical protein
MIAAVGPASISVPLATDAAPPCCSFECSIWLTFG